MNRDDLAKGVYRRLLQEVAEETRERAVSVDEVSRRFAARSQGEKAMMLRLLRGH